MSKELVSKCITTTTSGMDTIILPTPKRITVYSKPPEEDCVVISLSPDTITSIDDLYQHLERLFHMDDGAIKALYNAFGARICDIDAIRDEEILYMQKDRVEKAATPATSKPLRLARCRSGDWLTLNVGGQNFMTTRSTLVEQVQESMLARMFSSTDDASWQSKVDENGAFLIDRSPKYFEPILNYLRHGQLVLDKNLNPQGVLEEAKFFGIFPLIEQLEQMVKESQIPQETAPMTRREFVFKLVGSETGKELRCQGVNFTGANLSKLDLRSINFKYAIFKGADLSGCNLSHCNFERADFTQAKLDGALLLGAKLLCATLEEASICSANFEDPAGTRANMEGAHMKQVNLEGSHMSGVNLRVANLKNANLQNCNLRGAVLAGADLENCNLSGCDLQEANLRGANLKGAAFELMLNPLHMAQTVR